MKYEYENKINNLQSEVNNNNKEKNELKQNIIIIENEKKTNFENFNEISNSFHNLNKKYETELFARQQVIIIIIIIIIIK